METKQTTFAERVENLLRNHPEKLAAFKERQKTVEKNIEKARAEKAKPITPAKPKKK